MTQGDSRRHDLDKTVIRMGGRDYTATNLIAIAVFAVGGAALMVIAATTGWAPGYVWGGLAFLVVVLALLFP